MRRPLSVLALVLALSCTVLAGEIHNPPVPQGNIPNMPPADAAQQMAARGDIQNGQPSGAAVLALDLFRSVLGLF